MDDFMIPAHREIFDAMCAVEKRKQPLDVIAVADELKTRGMLARLDGGESYLLALANAVPTAENVEHYVRLVKEKATLRRLIAACATAQARAYADHGDFDEFLRDTYREILSVTLGAAAMKTETLTEIGEAVMADIEDAEQGKIVARVPTGIGRLDRMLRGGFHMEHLVVPCGLTSLGKSSFAFQTVFRAAARDRVPGLVITAEMSKKEVWVKGAATLGRMDSNAFSPPGPGERANWQAVQYGASKMNQITELVEIVELRDMGKIVPYITRWRALHQEPRALVVVDYLQRLHGYRAKGENRREELERICSDLKDLAKDLSCCIMAPAQVDNDAAKEKRAPTIGDIREAKGIEMASDVIIGIHRDRLVENGEAELIVLKHRGGRVGKVTCQWKGPWQGFEDEVAEDDRRLVD